VRQPADLRVRGGSARGASCGRRRTGQVRRRPEEVPQLALDQAVARRPGGRLGRGSTIDRMDIISLSVEFASDERHAQA
jgi:hypothetical protein